MKLLAIPDATGKPLLWINAEHLVSVSRVHLHDGRVKSVWVVYLSRDPSESG